MEEERSLVYTLILGVCMLLSLLLIGRMLLGHPVREAGNGPPGLPPQIEEKEEGGVEPLELDEGAICRLAAQKLPLGQVQARIGEDGTVGLSVSVSKRAIEESGMVPKNMRIALLLLPEQCHAEGEWQVAVDDGTLLLDCRGIRLEGISLPEEAADSLTAQLAEALNHEIQSWGGSLKKLVCEDGILRIEG